MKSTLLERLTSKKKRLYRLKIKVIDYFLGIRQEDVLDDQKKIVEYLKVNNISVFPYEFTKEYNPSDIELFRDSQLNLYYMLWEGKRLYYKKGNQKKAQKYFNSLRIEQDSRSPHRYLTEDFNVSENDVVLDVGAAEGNFALSVIERAGKIYLFEPDEDWIKALEATFAPWRDKVTIIKKFVSDKSSSESIALDDIFKENQSINFIKADVEGAEAKVIQGGRKIIEQQKKLNIAVCTYHRQEDSGVLSSMLSNFGFSNQFSDGYMLYYYGRSNVVKEPYLRKAVLRAVKI